MEIQTTINRRAQPTPSPTGQAGDLEGLHDSLPYLESLGINTIWISNPQTGPTGAWGGDCNATYSSYHGFWPSDWDSVDPHLGTLEDLDGFIEEAHDRGHAGMDGLGGQPRPSRTPFG